MEELTGDSAKHKDDISKLKGAYKKIQVFCQKTAEMILNMQQMGP
jgi:hypothetical protein